MMVEAPCFFCDGTGNQLTHDWTEEFCQACEGTGIDEVEILADDDIAAEIRESNRQNVFFKNLNPDQQAAVARFLIGEDTASNEYVTTGEVASFIRQFQNRFLFMSPPVVDGITDLVEQLDRCNAQANVAHVFKEVYLEKITHVD